MDEFEKEERQTMVAGIFAAHSRNSKAEWVTQVVLDTAEIPAQRFVDACAILRNMEDFPGNIGKELKKQAHKLAELAGEAGTFIPGCQRCYGLPGRVYVPNSCHPVFKGKKALPGGHIQPCICPAGDRYAWMNDDKYRPGWTKPGEVKSDRDTRTVEEYEERYR